MMEDLEDLLKQAKKQAWQTKERMRRGKPPKVVFKKQAEMEWTTGKTLCLIHRNSDGTETALGIFTEYLRNGSRWLRPSAESLTPEATEIVTGSWWLNPSIREIPVDSPAEVQAIRSRFEALLGEFTSEHPAFFAVEKAIEEDETDPEWDNGDDEEDDLEFDEDEDGDFEEDED